MMTETCHQFKLIDLAKTKRLTTVNIIRRDQRGRTAVIAVDITGFSLDEARTRTGHGYGLETD